MQIALSKAVFTGVDATFTKLFQYLAGNGSSPLDHKLEEAASCTCCLALHLISCMLSRFTSNCDAGMSTPDKIVAILGTSFQKCSLNITSRSIYSSQTTPSSYRPKHHSRLASNDSIPTPQTRSDSCVSSDVPFTSPSDEISATELYLSSKNSI